MAWKQNKKEGTVDELSTLLPDYESFEDTIGEMQALNGEITSQEIFLMYHKAYGCNRYVPKAHLLGTT